MSYQKTSLGLQGLCLIAVTAIMALGSASVAQAAGCTAATPMAKPCWMLNGVNVTADTTVTAIVKNDTLNVLLSKTIGTTIEIDCLEQAFVGNKVLLQPEGKATAEVEIKNCETYLGPGLTLTKGCKPIEPIVAGSELQIVLHEGESVIRASNGANPLTTIKFNEETCTVPDSPVKGTYWILDCLGDPEIELSEHLVIEGRLIDEMLGTLLTFGTELAAIDGSLIIKEVKVGASSALNFSILAN